MTYGDIIDMQLMKYDMDRKMLAQDLGISYQTLNHYINGFRTMRPQIRLAIDRTLCIDDETLKYLDE